MPFQTLRQNPRFFCPFLPAIECPKMSTINGGHYRIISFTVRAGTPDAYPFGALFAFFALMVVEALWKQKGAKFCVARNRTFAAVIASDQVVGF